MTQEISQSDLMRGVIPYLNVAGASEASAFYQKAFAAKEHARLPADDGKNLLHCHLEINGGSLMLSDCCPEADIGHPYGFTMTLVVSDADPWWSRAIAAGCQVTMPLETQFWGDRYGQLRDPFGVMWAFNEPAAPCGGN